MSTYNITEGMYKQIAESIYKYIESSSFASFSEKIEDLDESGISVDLTCTVVVYRRKPIEDPYGPVQLLGDIYDIVPIWWDAHFYDMESCKSIETDFYFKGLNKYLID